MLLKDTTANKTDENSGPYLHGPYIVMGETDNKLITEKRNSKIKKNQEIKPVRYVKHAE